MSDRYLDRLLGKYRVEALVGSGGFAWVYKAFDPDLEIPVALKVLKPQYAGDLVFEERFRREATVAARLRHPNIVKIFTVGKDGDAVYFAMDYLPHGLAERLATVNTLPESFVIRMGIDVASALGFAHRAGVIHRDIKIDNVLFDEHGNAVVADFGIARAVAGHVNQTGTGMVVGTPQYFAPEQARGLELDGRADLYSLGVTLYRAATGHLPFTGEDWYEIARQHVETSPPKPRELNPLLSRDFERVVLRCLEKDPIDRFATGEQLAGVLASLLHERGESNAARTMIVTPIDVTPSSTLAVRRALRRTTPRMWVAGLVGLAAAGATAAALRRARVQPGAAEPATPTVARSGAPPPAPSITAAVVRPALLVTAPANASIALNGVTVAMGTYRNDSLAVARYEVSATVRTVPGCPTARTVEQVVLDSGVHDVKLRPRACGTFTMDVRQPEATYRIVPSGGGRGVTGTGSVIDPMVLPVGAYQVVVEAPMCSQFVHDFRIEAGAAVRVPRVMLLCGKG